MTDKEEILSAIHNLAVTVQFQGEQLNALSHEVKSHGEQLTVLTHEVKSQGEELKSQGEQLKSQGERFTYFQQATQSLVNLAFGLIASATIVTLASSIFKR